MSDIVRGAVNTETEALQSVPCATLDDVLLVLSRIEKILLRAHPAPMNLEVKSAKPFEFPPLDWH